MYSPEVEVGGGGGGVLGPKMESYQIRENAYQIGNPLWGESAAQRPKIFGGRGVSGKISCLFGSFLLSELFRGRGRWGGGGGGGGVSPARKSSLPDKGLRTMFPTR